MALSTFKRGLRLPPRKHATEGRPIELSPIPQQVAIPINQHFGSPNKSIVNSGDTVVRGQKIADAADSAEGARPLAVPVHASISGKVVKIELMALSNNTVGPCIVIDAQGPQDQEEFLPPLDPFTCTREEILERIREAGIVGKGGAGFPTYVKLSPPPGKNIDCIIANGAECEPYLTIDAAVMIEKTDLFIKGIAIAMHVTGVTRAIIGLEEHNRQLVPIIEQELQAQSISGDISVRLCKARYPQGGEKMLIKALTGREVPSGGLPMDAGCIVFNIGTIVSIAVAFTQGKPFIDRYLTVSGGACKTPKNIRIPIGASLKDLPADFMDIDYSRLARILYGGPMMGSAVASLEVPVQKNTSGIILMTKEETALYAEGPCIRCARCLNNCTCRLAPVMIKENIDAGDYDYAVKAGLMDCVECGTCSYVCPARIKLVQRFRVGKQLLRNKKHG